MAKLWKHERKTCSNMGKSGRLGKRSAITMQCQMKEIPSAWKTLERILDFSRRFSSFEHRNCIRLASFASTALEIFCKTRDSNWWTLNKEENFQGKTIFAISKLLEKLLFFSLIGLHFKTQNNTKFSPFGVRNFLN